MITIINDFFEEDKLEQVINHIKNNISFAPQWTGDKSNTKDNFYGNRFCLNNDENLLYFSMYRNHSYQIRLNL